mmetsp:Transcript_7977/g.26296  ORF Transcript_7977/g.26296 Transcript_7977/m.26296 type:complete len:240 (-) Transcript_7977:123-842(-)
MHTDADSMLYFIFHVSIGRNDPTSHNVTFFPSAVVMYFPSSEISIDVTAFSVFNVVAMIPVLASHTLKSGLSEHELKINSSLHMYRAVLIWLGAPVNSLIGCVTLVILSLSLFLLSNSNFRKSNILTTFSLPPVINFVPHVLKQTVLTMCLCANVCKQSPVMALNSFAEKSALAVAQCVAGAFNVASQHAPRCPSNVPIQSPDCASRNIGFPSFEDDTRNVPSGVSLEYSKETIGRLWP